MRALRAAVVASVIVGGAIPGASAAQAATANSGPRRGRVLVSFRPGTAAAGVSAAHARAGAGHHEPVAGLGLEVAEVDDVDRAVAAYQARPEVAYAEPDGEVHALVQPADASYPANQWNLQSLSAANRGTADWEPVYPDVQGLGVAVAVLDTGFRPGGSDQPVNLLMGLGYDFVNGDADPTDDGGHGTHVTGTIAQNTGNNPVLPATGPSVAGVAPLAGIIPIKVLDANGDGSVSATVAGIALALTRGAKVINLSLGGPYSRALCDSVGIASRSAVVVAASGNESNGGMAPVDYPAACPGALAVGGLRYDGSRGPYSNGSCETDVTAPGGDVSPSRLFGAADPRNAILQETYSPTLARFGFFFDTGTSMASAHAAGAAALLLGLNPDVGVVTRALRATARDLGRRGPDDAFGSGALDIAAAVAALRAGAQPVPGEALGYWTVASDGGIFSFGDASFFGSTGGLGLNKPIVGMARTATGNGYWLVASDGGIFSFGDAAFLGSTGDLKLNQPIVGITATSTGNGYWLVASDGGIFSFGDAAFLGSTGGTPLNQPIRAMTASRFGGGYWLVGADGGIFAFGDAAFLGSTGGSPLNRPIVGMARTGTGAGYWLVASDGGIFAFGDAPFAGSTGDIALNRPIVGMAPTCSGAGYWLVASDGGVFSFGDGRFLGSTGDLVLNRPIVGLTVALDHRSNR